MRYFPEPSARPLIALIHGVSSLETYIAVSARDVYFARKEQKGGPSRRRCARAHVVDMNPDDPEGVGRTMLAGECQGT
jgi:hypothetical protein